MPGLVSGVQNRGQGFAVDGGHDQEIHAVGDQVLNVVDLLRHIVVGIGELHLVAGGLELFLQVGAVTVPTLQGLGGHCNADLSAAAGFAAGLAGFCGFTLICGLFRWSFRRQATRDRAITRDSASARNFFIRILLLGPIPAEWDKIREAGRFCNLIL